MLSSLIYYGIIALWSAGIAYYALFVAIPYLTGKKQKKSEHHHASAHVQHHAPHGTASRTRFSAHEGFKSFAQNAELTVEDIVKGLSREN